MAAADIRRLVGRHVWDNYFKFSIDRNPWDAVISAYYWQLHDGQLEGTGINSVGDFVRSPRMANVVRNFELYSIRGQVAVDRVCRFEYLADELEEIRRRLALPQPLDLPRAKGGARKDRRHYSEVLTDEEASIVARAASGTIAHLGYTF